MQKRKETKKMIIKFEHFNEGIKSLLVGPTKENVWDNLFKDRLSGFITSIPDSPEDFFNQMKDGCSKMGEDEYGIYWGKNGIKLFQQNSKNESLYISHKYVWSVLEKFYGLNYDEIQSLIKNLLVGDTNWMGLTPTFSDLQYRL